jgi:mevalonate kinase
MNPSPEALQSLKEAFGHISLQSSQCVMSTAFLVANIFPELTYDTSTTGLQIRIKSIGLPLGAGLGSSAAFSVSLSGALIQLRNLVFHDLCEINVDDDEWTPPESVLEILNGWSYGTFI